MMTTETSTLNRISESLNEPLQIILGLGISTEEELVEWLRSNEITMIAYQKYQMRGEKVIAKEKLLLTEDYVIKAVVICDDGIKSIVNMVGGRNPENQNTLKAWKIAKINLN